MSVRNIPWGLCFNYKYEGTKWDCAIFGNLSTEFIHLACPCLYLVDMSHLIKRSKGGGGEVREWRREGGFVYCCSRFLLLWFIDKNDHALKIVPDCYSLLFLINFWVECTFGGPDVGQFVHGISYILIMI